MENIIGILSVIVAALSVLVMLLIGWNIYTVYDAGKKIESLKKYVDEQQERTDETLNYLQMRTFMSLSDFYRKIGVMHEYFIHSILVVKHALNGQDFNTANIYIKDMHDQVPINEPIENFYKAHILRELFDLKMHPLVSELHLFDQLFSRINDGLDSQ